MVILQNDCTCNTTASVESRNMDKILLSNAHTALHDLALFEMQTNNHPFELARSTPLGSHDPRQKRVILLQARTIGPYTSAATSGAYEVHRFKAKHKLKGNYNLVALFPLAL